MKCLRCGYCCINYMVPIIDNPERGFIEDNIIFHFGLGIKCKHLDGEKPGKFSCKIHDKKWYKKTPCFLFGQIESSPNKPCRMGVYILQKGARS